MNIEKRNLKMFNIISVVVLTAVLFTAIGGIIIQRQGLLLENGGMGFNKGTDPMLPQSTQTGPTGKMVLTTGILLLTVGFGVLVVILFVRRNLLHRNSS